MTNWRMSVGLKGRWDKEGVIPSEADGRVEESVGNHRVGGWLWCLGALGGEEDRLQDK